MREKYESLSLSVLRDLAKARGLKGISTLKKADLIERMLQEDEKSQQHENQHREENTRTEVGKAENVRMENNRAEHKRAETAQEKSRDMQENGHVHSDKKSVLNNEGLDSGEKANGILEVLPDGYGFIRCENYLPGENDIYVSQSQIRKFNLKTGDIIQGNIRVNQGEKFRALLYVTSVNGFHPNESVKRHNFEDMTPISTVLQ